MAASPRRGKQPRSGGGGGGGGATTARKTRKLPPRHANRIILTRADELVFGKVIGRGSQGCVRLAKHRATGKRYVVKLLNLNNSGYDDDNMRAGGGGRTGLSISDDEVRALEAEATLLKLASNHPNIVRFHGWFKRDPNDTNTNTSGASSDTGGDGKGANASQLCIVMSHCEGGDLATLLKSVGHEPLPEDAIMRWLVQLLLGLNHIHSMAILHRDIKPANVFLTKSLKVIKVGDFGIAKRLSEHDDLANTVVGTPYYM